MTMNNKKILIIDDTRVNRKILRAIFDDAFDIYEAENEQEVIDFSRHVRDFSLIILYLKMS